VELVFFSFEEIVGASYLVMLSFPLPIQSIIYVLCVALPTDKSVFASYLYIAILYLNQLKNLIAKEASKYFKLSICDIFTNKEKEKDWKAWQCSTVH
jgi:hypothetical protein